MSARDLFGVILRSFGVASILWGLDDFLRVPPIMMSSGWAFVPGTPPDFAGGSVIHLNVMLLGPVLKLLVGIPLLVWGARVARWFYPDKP
jgi:hypothetical protein